MGRPRRRQRKERKGRTPARLAVQSPVSVAVSHPLLALLCIIQSKACDLYASSSFYPKQSSISPKGLSGFQPLIFVCSGQGRSQICIMLKVKCPQWLKKNAKKSSILSIAHMVGECFTLYWFCGW